MRSFAGDKYYVRSVSLSPNDRLALSGSADGTLRLWNVTHANCVRVFQGHTDIVNSVMISPDGRLGLSGSNDASLRLWNLATGKSVRTYGNVFPGTSVAISPDGRFGLSGSFRGTCVALWDLECSEPVRTWEGHTDYLTFVDFLPEGRFALSGSADSTVRLWNVASGICTQTFPTGANMVRCGALTPDGRAFLCGSADAKLLL